MNNNAFVYNNANTRLYTRLPGIHIKWLFTRSRFQRKKAINTAVWPTYKNGYIHIHGSHFQCKKCLKKKNGFRTFK